MLSLMKKFPSVVKALVLWLALDVLHAEQLAARLKAAVA